MGSNIDTFYTYSRVYMCDSAAHNINSSKTHIPYLYMNKKNKEEQY